MDFLNCKQFDNYHLATEEFQLISFVDDSLTMYIAEAIQNDIGQWKDLVEEDIKL